MCLFKLRHKSHSLGRTCDEAKTNIRYMNCSSFVLDAMTFVKKISSLPVSPSLLSQRSGTLDSLSGCNLALQVSQPLTKPTFTHCICTVVVWRGPLKPILTLGSLSRWRIYSAR